MVLTTARLCVPDSYGQDFAFYLDSFLFLISLRTFIASKLLIWSTVVSSGPLAQWVERGAHKGKVLCSMLKEYKSTRVQEYKSTRVQEYKSTRVS